MPVSKTLYETLEKYLNTEECKKSLKEYFETETRKEDYIERRCKWFYEKPIDYRKNFIKKVIEFYNSDKYINRWYNRAIEPPIDLYWMIYEYSRRYGEDVYNIVSDNPDSFIFTSEFNKIEEGYYVERMDGQGSVIHLIEENELETEIKRRSKPLNH